MALSALLAGCDGDDQPSAPARPSADLRQAAQAFDGRRAFADLRAQVRIGPRPAGSRGSRREVGLIVARLRAAGVREAEVQRPHRNVVAVVPGVGDGTIVLGAHHDTKDGIPGFVGANDGASGVAVLLELARVLPRPFPGPSIVLAFFDAEEARGNRPFEVDGTRGSRQFARLAAAGGRGGSPPLESIRAMYLLDLVGDCDLRIPRETNSDPELYRRLRGPAFGGEAPPVLDDHIPFVEEGVPAVDLIDFDYGPGPSPGAWFHTPEDTLDKVCPESLGQVGRAVIGALGTH
jgi:glutaminyl-peptide cyclotransferase